MNFTELKIKLIYAGIPEDIAKKYAMYYERGFMPELAFDNDEMPSDDCFKTLAEIYNYFYKTKGKTITELEIKNILYIPYSQVETTQKKLEEFFPKHSKEILELYKKDIIIFYLRPDEVTHLYELVSDYISEDEKIWEVFKRSVNAGIFYTESRFEAIADAVGEQLAPEVIYESAVNGWLLYPYYTDPVEALKYLRTQFDEQTTAKIILENPDYLYLYEDKYYIEFPEQKEKREKNIAAIIEKYK